MTTRCHVRCRACETRRVLPRAPAKMRRLPVCSGCGKKDYRPDKWMNQRPTGVPGMGCNCGGYHFTHRRGSPYCVENPLADLRWAWRYDCDDIAERADRLAKERPELAGHINELLTDWGMK